MFYMSRSNDTDRAQAVQEGPQINILREQTHDTNFITILYAQL